MTTRTRALAVTAAALTLTCGMTVAYSATQQPDARTVTACVTIKTGAMRLETAKAPCRVNAADRTKRERRLTWNKRGVPGLPGADGVDGADGMDGVDGTNGADGATGTPGATGAPGAPGSPGSPGTDGSSFLSGTGAPATSLGADGDSYLDTNTGNVYSKSAGVWSTSGNLRGPTGPAGQDGAGQAQYLSSSAKEVSLSTMLSQPQTSIVLPVSGASAADSMQFGPGGTVNGSTAPTRGYVQTLQVDTTLTGIGGTFDVSSNVTLPGTFDISVRLFTGNSTSSTLSAVPGATCTMPSLSGSVADGAMFSCWKDGLSIPIAAGSTAIVVVSATSSFPSGQFVTGYPSSTLTTG